MQLLKVFSSYFSLFSFLLLLPTSFSQPKYAENNYEYYSINGYGNNLENPTWGMARTYYLRGNGTKSYQPSDWDRRTDLLNPRYISSNVFGSGPPVDSNRGHNMLQTYWGQFIDHDTTRTLLGNESWPIIPPDDDGTFHTPLQFTRSAWEGTSDDRLYINEVTSFLDLSTVYGSDNNTLQLLREEASCKLRTSWGSEQAGVLLARNYQNYSMENEGFYAGRVGTTTLFMAGDIRANENPGLTALQTVFLREHNRLCDQLSEENPAWDQEHLFWEARRWNIAFAQQITIKEYQTAVINMAPSLYQGYDPNINPTINHFYATVAFRYGHSEVQEYIPRVFQTTNQSDRLLLKQCFYNPSCWVDQGIDPIILGLSQAFQSEVDHIYAPTLVNFLFGRPDLGGQDLGARNIQRGRDHQMPNYIEMRAFWGLSPINSFEDINEDPDTVQILKNAYKGNLSLIDPYVGGLAEGFKPNGSGLGPTYTAAVLDQYTRLRHGDRLWFESPYSGFTQDDLQVIKSTRLADIIIRNTDITSISCSAFWLLEGQVKCGPQALQESDNVVLGGTMIFTWRVIGDDIEITLTAQTVGWMGIGIPKIAGYMTNSHIHVAQYHQTTPPTVTVTEYNVGNDRTFGCSTGVCLDPVQSVAEDSVHGNQTFINGQWWTSVTFRRPTTTENPNDEPFRPGLMNFNLAYGPTVTFGYHGPTKATTQLMIFREFPVVPVLPATSAAWVAFVALCILCVFSSILSIVRQKEFPLRALSHSLNLLITFGTSLFINIPLSIIVGNRYPCEVFWWCYLLAPGFFSSPILVSMYRHSEMVQLAKMKKKLASSPIAPKEVEIMNRKKELVSESRLVSMTLMLDIVPLFIGVCIRRVSDDYGYNSGGEKGCHMGQVIKYSLLSYTVFYGLLISVGLYLIRRNEEFFGYRRNIGWLLIVGSFFFVLLSILLLVTPRTPQEKDDLALMLVIVPGFYQLFGIFLPSFQTFPILACSFKAIDVHLVEPLSEVLVTRNGFAWFYYFTTREFSQENPLGWRAIHNFKNKTSYNAMKDIYSKFFSKDAPLQINLSDRSVRILTQTIEKTTRDTPLEVLQTIFDAIQLEIMDLMETDSYGRFINSPFYQRYKQNDVAPKAIDEVSRVESSESSKEGKIPQSPSTELVRLTAATVGTPPQGGSPQSPNRSSLPTTSEEERYSESQGLNNSRKSLLVSLQSPSLESDPLPQFSPSFSTSLLQQSSSSVPLPTIEEIKKNVTDLFPDPRASEGRRVDELMEVQ